MGILKPVLNNVEEESWEELENVNIGSGAQSLCWLVWVSHVWYYNNLVFDLFTSTLVSKYAFVLLSSLQTNIGHGLCILIFLF